MSYPVIIDATAKHTATLIFLHGLGDVGHGWAGIMEALRPAHAKVICPTASTMPVTINGGAPLPSWFDLKSLSASGAEDEQGIKQAANVIQNMMATEIKAGIAANRIVLGGFSQGGALALYSALTQSQKLAGLVALSSWLPLMKSFPSMQKCPTDIPVLQCHGDSDSMVSYQWAQTSASVLRTLLKNVSFKTYRGMAHDASDEELNDVKVFVTKHLPKE